MRMVTKKTKKLLLKIQMMAKRVPNRILMERRPKEPLTMRRKGRRRPRRVLKKKLS